MCIGTNTCMFVQLYLLSLSKQHAESHLVQSGLHLGLSSRGGAILTTAKLREGMGVVKHFSCAHIVMRSLVYRIAGKFGRELRLWVTVRPYTGIPHSQ